MNETGLQQIFALTPITTNHYLHTAVSVLLKTVDHMPEASIVWPATVAKFQELSDLITSLHPLLISAFESVNGLCLPVQVSSDQKIENVTYSRQHHNHSINNVLVFLPKGTFSTE